MSRRRIRTFETTRITIKEENMIKAAIKKLVLGEGLGEKEAEEVLGRVIDGKVPASQVGALLTALRMKGESVDEITGAARALKTRLYRFQLNNHLLNLLFC